MDQELAHGAGRRGADLDGADELGLVVGMNAESGFGIEAAQQSPERSGAAAMTQAAAKILVALGSVEEAFEHGAQVEAGASADDGKASATGDCGGGGTGLAGVVSSGEPGVGGDDVDEVVRDDGALFERWFGGADFEFAVDGNRVAADDLATEFEGQGDGERGLAAGGGAGDDQQRGLG